jgi:hypothetical protein
MSVMARRRQSSLKKQIEDKKRRLAAEKELLNKTVEDAEKETDELIEKGSENVTNRKRKS